MRIINWFDAWVVKGPFTGRDLGIYRIVLCLLLLPYTPKLRNLAGYPESFFEPPPGPFGQLSGWPSEPVLIGIEFLTILLTMTTLVGWYTKFSSIALSVVLIFGYGLTFATGKVDHLIVMMIVPGVLAFANWGNSLSIDALRKRRSARSGGHRQTQSEPGAQAPSMADSPENQLQWPIRFLALAIGIAFCTAALPKLLNGWLKLSTQATYGFQVQQDFVRGATSWPSTLLVDLHVPVLWEGLDWITIILECAVILCVLSWRSWRIVLAVLTMFHLAIAISLGIFFAGNVLAYGAFVSWGKLRLPKVRVSERTADLLVRYVPVLVIVGTIAVWFIEAAIPGVLQQKSMLIVGAGAVIGVGYLAMQAVELARLVKRRRSVPAGNHSR